MNRTVVAFPGAKPLAPAESQFAFSGVTLDLGGKTIIANLNLEVRAGEFLCIIGASGCGKTTALRLAAGLYQPTAGQVTFDGQPMPAPRRDVFAAISRISEVDDGFLKACRFVCHEPSMSKTVHLVKYIITQTCPIPRLNRHARRAAIP